MVVTELNKAILCEYQIKIVDKNEDAELAESRNKYNHLLYEFERSDSMFELVNAIEFTINVMRKKKESSAIKNLNKDV